MEGHWLLQQEILESICKNLTLEEGLILLETFTELKSLNCPVKINDPDGIINVLPEVNLEMRTLKTYIEFQGSKEMLIDMVRNNNLDLVRKLLHLGADIDGIANYTNPLIEAVVTNNVDIISELLKRGANVNIAVPTVPIPRIPSPIPQITGRTPLMMAVRWGQIHNVKTLIKAGADVNLGYGGNTPLSLSRFLRQATITDLLIAAGAH